MAEQVNLFNGCEWVCDVLNDLSDALKKAGYKITPDALEECRLTLILESANIEHQEKATVHSPQEGLDNIQVI